MTISFGLVVFNSSKMKGGFGDDSLFGIFLVILSLLFDGFVNSQTDRNHQKEKRAFAYHSMLYNSIINLVGNLAFFAFACWVQEDTTL